MGTDPSPSRALLAGLALALAAGTVAAREGEDVPPAESVEAAGQTGQTEAGAAEAPEPARSPREEAIWVLRSIRLPEPPLEDPVSALAELVPKTADDLLTYLRERRIPELGEEPAQTMSVYQHQLLLDAVEASDPKPMIAAVGRMLHASDDALSQATAIEIHGATGTAKVLESIRVQVEAVPHDEIGRRLEEAVGQAVEAILRRDAEGQRELLSSWRVWRPELLPSVISAVGSARDPSGLELLNEVLGWNRDLRLLCLAQIRLLGSSGDEVLDGAIATTVRELLTEDDGRMRKAALLALGDLEDLQSIPTMIAMLGSEVAGERENALWALRRATGIQLNDQVTTWRVWFEQESDWYDRADALFDRIDSRRAYEVSSAIREISKHYLHRHRLAREVARALGHRRPSIRVAACEGLARLGSRTVLAELVGALEDEEDDVRLAAHRALVELTGSDLGDEPEDWIGAI